MTILERLREIAEGKCTGLLAEEAETLLEVVEAAIEVAEDACSAGGKDCHIVESNLIDDLRFALAELRADDA